MENTIFKLFTISLILLINVDDSKQEGDFIDINKLEETYVALNANLQTLILSENDLMKA